MASVNLHVKYYLSSCSRICNKIRETISARSVLVWRHSDHALASRPEGLRRHDMQSIGLYLVSVQCVRVCVHVRIRIRMNEIINSLVPGRCSCSRKLVIFKLMPKIDISGTHCEIALTWMPHYLTGDQSTLVQIMAWCRQATSHYLRQCWPKSMLSYGVPRPQWVRHPLVDRY